MKLNASNVAVITLTDGTIIYTAESCEERVLSALFKKERDKATITHRRGKFLSEETLASLSSEPKKQPAPTPKPGQRLPSYEMVSYIADRLKAGANEDALIVSVSKMLATPASQYTSARKRARRLIDMAKTKIKAINNGA